MINATEDVLRIHTLQDKFNQIEDKNKCLRVQFLDWLSNKMLDWSKQIKQVSDRIDAPCVIRFDKPEKHKSVYEEIDQADYIATGLSQYTDVKGLRAGKSLDECTYVMLQDGSLKSRAQSRAEMSDEIRAASDRIDAEIKRVEEERQLQF